MVVNIRNRIIEDNQDEPIKIGAVEKDFIEDYKEKQGVTQNKIIEVLNEDHDRLNCIDSRNIDDEEICTSSWDRSIFWNF